MKSELERVLCFIGHHSNYKNALELLSIQVGDIRTESDLRRLNNLTLYEVTNFKKQSLYGTRAYSAFHYIYGELASYGNLGYVWKFFYESFFRCTLVINMIVQ